MRKHGPLDLARIPPREHCVMGARVVITIALRARASDGTFQVVRRSVGAPTAHACAGNGSHHPEDISPGRGGPPGELFRALLGAGTRRSRRRSAAEEPLWVDARGSLSRPDLVRREGDA